MKIQEEITNLIEYLQDHDQPNEEIARQIIRLIRHKDINYITQD